MQRLAVAAILLAACLAACGTTDDERPQNLDYITEAILAPNCGGATCHSQFKQEQGYVFDNILGARRSFQTDPQLISFDTSDPEKLPGLVLNLTLEQPGAPRMPYAAPLPDVDVELIKRWLEFGAPGVCDGIPNACLGDFVLPCHDVKTHKNPDVVEKAAYDLSHIDTARNCALEQKHCVAGDCQ